MQFMCELSDLGAQGWRGRYTGRDVGTVTVTAPTREAVVEKLQNEIRYRLEYCPCSGEAYRDIGIDIAEQPTEKSPSSKTGSMADRSRI